MKLTHEAALIRAFVVPGKRERVVELLSKAKRWQDVLRRLAHFRDLDPRFQVEIPRAAQWLIERVSDPAVMRARR